LKKDKEEESYIMIGNQYGSTTRKSKKHNAKNWKKGEGKNIRTRGEQRRIGSKQHMNCSKSASVASHDLKEPLQRSILVQITS
jgi:hypothetical protein